MGTWKQAAQLLHCVTAQLALSSRIDSCKFRFPLILNVCWIIVLWSLHWIKNCGARTDKEELLFIERTRWTKNDHLVAHIRICGLG